MDEERMVTVSAADLEDVLDGFGVEDPDDYRWESYERLRKVIPQRPVEISFFRRDLPPDVTVTVEPMPGTFTAGS
jgi:hypothetical protein